MKVAVVSAYYKESPQVLQRCIDSVAVQTHRCTHFLVSEVIRRPSSTPSRCVT